MSLVKFHYPQTLHNFHCVLVTVTTALLHCLWLYGLGYVVVYYLRIWLVTEVFSHTWFLWHMKNEEQLEQELNNMYLLSGA